MHFWMNKTFRDNFAKHRNIFHHKYLKLDYNTQINKVEWLSIQSFKKKLKLFIQNHVTSTITLLGLRLWKILENSIKQVPCQKLRLRTVFVCFPYTNKTFSVFLKQKIIPKIWFIACTTLLGQTNLMISNIFTYRW